MYEGDVRCDVCEGDVRYDVCVRCDVCVRVM